MMMINYYFFFEKKGHDIHQKRGAGRGRRKEGSNFSPCKMKRLQASFPAQTAPEALAGIGGWQRPAPLAPPRWPEPSPPTACRRAPGGDGQGRTRCGRGRAGGGRMPC